MANNLKNNFSIRNMSLIVLFSMLLLSVGICSSGFAHAAQPFNVDIELPQTYHETTQGTEVWFTIKMLNLANSKRVDVTLNYEILDSKNDSIVHNAKTVAVETQASFVASLILPSDTAPGDYYIHVTVSSPSGDSSATTSFKVIDPHADMMKYYYIGGAVIGLVLLILIISLMVSKLRPVIERHRLRMKIKKIVQEKLGKD